jgi:hypothetical protein
MEPKVSLPCSQEPTAGLYPETDEFSPHAIYFRSSLILYCHLFPDVPSGLLLSRFMAKVLYAFSSPPSLLHALLISSLI